MKVKIIIKSCIVMLAICIIYIFFDFTLNNGKYSKVEGNDLQSMNMDNRKAKSNEPTSIKEGVNFAENEDKILKESSADEATSSKLLSLNGRVLPDKELLIGNKPVIDLQYADVIKIWGIPKEIKMVKVYFPATPEPNYAYILKYSSIDIEMYPDNENTPIENTRSFRFDITGDEYDFYGAKIGMSLENYLRRVENKNVYSVKDILSDTKGEIYPYVYRKLLYSVKPENYYSSYDKAVYEQVVINSFPYGVVILFNADKVARIVYGYPNAS